MEQATIADLSVAMAHGELTSESITRQYLARIERIDKAGPKVNAVIQLNPDALAIAAARDRERAQGRLRGPLHGIPILLKDNIETHDSMPTTAGSLALKGHLARRDAHLVKRLRRTGAVILGKANLSEWANFRGRRSVSGWSSVGGLTRNPHALDRTACGSSSGSAAAVAADLCAAAVGTETDGSIICPSQSCGVVGLKPTVGLISRRGIIPIAHSQDTAGPIGRTVSDVAVLLGAMAGNDPGDSVTQSRPKPRIRDYTRFLAEDGLKGARIGVARNMLGTDQRIIAIVESSLDVMRQAGAVIIDPADLPHLQDISESELEVLHTEFKAYIGSYLASLRAQARVHSLEELVEFNLAHREQVMPYFGQEHLTEALSKDGLSSQAYRQALGTCRRLTRKEGIDALMARERLDAIVVASGGPAWLIDLVNGDSPNWDLESTSPAAVAGYPHITVPAGFIRGLPIGLSFFAGAWQEATLLKLAYAFEQVSQVRRPPQFRKSALV
jgi:amidase